MFIVIYILRMLNFIITFDDFHNNSFWNDFFFRVPFMHFGSYVLFGTSLRQFLGQTCDRFLN